MASLHPTWLTHLVLADQRCPDFTFVCEDRVALPLKPLSAHGRVQEIAPVTWIVETGGGGRFLNTSGQPSGHFATSGPVILLSDHTCADDVGQVIETLDRPLTAILHCGAAVPLEGFSPISPMLPGLFTSQDGQEVIQDLLQIASDHCRQGGDGFDALMELCDPCPHLHRVHFHADGDALIELSPLALVRDFDPASGQRLIFSGVVHLHRWRPIVLRVPVFGLSEPEIHISFSDDAVPGTVTCHRKGRGGLSDLGKSDAASDALRVRPTGPPRHYVDLTLTGHGTQIESVSVRLPPLTPQRPDTKLDPLEEYADPLANYG